MTNETEATEGVGPVVEATPETTGEAPVVESPMGETEGEESVVDSGAQAPAIEVPEVTQEPAVESESASPVAENAESETTAQESSEVQNTQESSANGEMSSEERAEKFRRIDEVATKLDDGVKDSFKGLTPEQIQMLADVNGQVAELAALTDLTEDEINKIDNLTSKAEVAFSHHIDYLKNQRDDTWDVRAQKLSDFLKMLSLEDWESDEQSEEGRKRHEQVITGILGPRERMSKHRVQAIDWRKRSMEASGATYKQDVEKKVAQNKEAIVNNVMSALDKTAELVANVSTVGDRARRTREVLLNKALNVGDNLNRAGDFSVNFLGNVLDIYYGLGVAALPAARAAGAEVMLGVGKVGETINTQVETSVKNGIDYMVAQLQRMRENARQRAERAEAARQERINELKKTANSLSEASEKYRADADKAKGLRGWIRGLVAR